MLGSDSFIRGINVYLVENVIQTALVFALVLAAMRLLPIRDPNVRIRLLLLPTLIPFVAPPVYYLVFPMRREMSVLAVDQIFDIERIVALVPYSDFFLTTVTIGMVSLGVFWALKGALSIAAMLYLPRRYRTLKRGDDPRLDGVLERTFTRAGAPYPVVLLSPESSWRCCGVGLGRAYLFVSQRCLRELNEEQLESVLTHELAHISRGDSIFSLLLFIQRHLLFFNPFIHLIHRRKQEEIEIASDRQALSCGLNPRPYVRNLLEVWRISMACAHEPLPLASHVVSDKKSLGRRVSALLDPASAQEPSWFISWTPAFLSPALVLGLFFLC